MRQLLIYRIKRITIHFNTAIYRTAIFHAISHFIPFLPQKYKKVDKKSRSSE
jgi:hypothetical protein